MTDKKRKKFKDTKVGQFLLGKSGLVKAIGDVMPDKGLLGVVKNLINNDPELPQQDKEVALALLKQDIVEAQEISKRWESDMTSDSWLSKNRPMTLIFLTVSLIVFILLDSFNIEFGIDSGWIDLLKSLLITVYVAYFGSRGAEKFKSIGNNK